MSSFSFINFLSILSLLFLSLSLICSGIIACFGEVFGDDDDLINIEFTLILF